MNNIRYRVIFIGKEFKGDNNSLKRIEIEKGESLWKNQRIYVKVLAQAAFMQHYVMSDNIYKD